MHIRTRIEGLVHSTDGSGHSRFVFNSRRIANLRHVLKSNSLDHSGTWSDQEGVLGSALCYVAVFGGGGVGSGISGSTSAMSV